MPNDTKPKPPSGPAKNRSVRPTFPKGYQYKPDEEKTRKVTITVSNKLADLVVGKAKNESRPISNVYAEIISAFFGPGA